MIVSLTNPAAVELSIWMDDLGCGQPISVTVLPMGTMSWAMYRAASSASAAEAITNLMICAMDRMGAIHARYWFIL